MLRGSAASTYLGKEAFFARAFEVRGYTATLESHTKPTFHLKDSIRETSDKFTNQFENAGVAVGNSVWTKRLEPKKGPIARLDSVVERGVDDQFYAPNGSIEGWRALKAAKAVKRRAKNGFECEYAEGPLQTTSTVPPGRFSPRKVA